VLSKPIGNHTCGILEAGSTRFSGLFADRSRTGCACAAVSRQYRVKLHSARITPVGRQTQNALQRQHLAFFDAVAPNPLKPGIAAARAMSLQEQPEGNFVRMEPRLAGAAAPRQHADQAQRVVAQVAPARSSALACLADRTNHGTGPQAFAFPARQLQSSKPNLRRKPGDAVAFVECSSRVE